jgi:shikimate dehydrogenase
MKVFAIFGDPIEHSLSPRMQNAAFRAMGLDAHYDAFRVPRENLSDAILGAKAMSFGGLNLTIPLKEKALKIVVPDDLAKDIGAVNTVSFGQEIQGHNTDGLGARMALERAGARVRGDKALILGAGGAAKAIAYALAKGGADLDIANRNQDRASDLARKVGGRGCGLDDASRLIPKADIIVNATSVGMREGDPRLIDGRLLRPGQTVFDIVYNRETELLKDAALAGAKAIDGVAMLVYQGAEAIKIWTGKEAPIEVMEKAVRDALSSKAQGMESEVQKTGKAGVPHD